MGNAGMGMFVVHERYMTLADEDAQIFDAHFKGTMPEKTFKTLLAHGEIVHAEGPQELLQEGEIIMVTEPQELIRRGDVADLVLVLEGEAELVMDDNSISHVGPGGLLGEVSFLGGVKASSVAMSVPGSRYLVWRHKDLKDLVAQQPDLARGLELFIGAELMRKLSGGTWVLAQAS